MSSARKEDKNPKSTSSSCTDATDKLAPETMPYQGAPCLSLDRCLDPGLLVAKRSHGICVYSSGLLLSTAAEGELYLSCQYDISDLFITKHPSSCFSVMLRVHGELVTFPSFKDSQFHGCMSRLAKIIVALRGVPWAVDTWATKDHRNQANVFGAPNAGFNFIL